MVNELLVNLVDSVLTKGKKTARGNKAYPCPFCHSSKPKLEINFTQNKKNNNPWHCWVCDKKGNKISTIFKQAQATPEKYQELKSISSSPADLYEEQNTKPNEIKLPKEAQPILGNTRVLAKHAYTFLKKRGLTNVDIQKYNIKYCEFGEYSHMVIVPSYDEQGNLNYFVGRSFHSNPYRKYLIPSASRDIIFFDLYINWDLPIILCEGVFDAITIKRNAIPLLGKSISHKLMKKIIISKNNKIYIALDGDAYKQSLKIANTLLDYGKEVYVVNLQDKDPNEIGFKTFTNLIKQTPRTNSYNLLEQQLQIL
jgi:DNA primase